MTVLNTAANVYNGAAHAAAVYAGTVKVWPPAPTDPVLMAYHQDWPGWSVPDTLAGGVFSRTQKAAALGGGEGFSTDGNVGANRYSFLFDVAAGTYTLTHTGSTQANYGIVTVQIDGVTVATLDMYGTTTANVVRTVSGIVLAAGNHSLMLNVLGKNGSATNYYNVTQWLSLDRTGA